MSLYCMCEAQNDKPDSQAFGAPNRYCSSESSLGGKVDSAFPPLALRTAMVCIKTGALQVILLDDQNGPNMLADAARPGRWRNHYPNVDVFECPNCRARIVRDK